MCLIVDNVCFKISDAKLHPMIETTKFLELIFVNENLKNLNGIPHKGYLIKYLIERRVGADQSQHPSSPITPQK